MEVNTCKIEDFRNKALDRNITSRAFKEDTKKKSFFHLGITRVKKESGDGGTAGVKGIKLRQGLVTACFENGNEGYASGTEGNFLTSRETCLLVYVGVKVHACLYVRVRCYVPECVCSREDVHKSMLLSMFRAVR
jgi:hypothetical protein